MYQVYCDDTLLYDPRLKELAIEAPAVELELNKTGSFSFSIYPDHPYADKIKPLHSIILVKKGGTAPVPWAGDRRRRGVLPGKENIL